MESTARIVAITTGRSIAGALAVSFSLAFGAVLATGEASADIQLTPDQIIDAAIGDWNRDGRTDLAILAGAGEPDMMVGVYIYLRDPEGGLLKSVLALPDKVWGRSHEGGFYGQEPSITALENGSIVITEQNHAIGRERWETKRTLAYRNGAFVVAGFTFDYYDSVQEYDALRCDLNFLSGKGTINEAEISFETGALPLEKWKDEAGSNPGLKICRKK